MRRIQGKTVLIIRVEEKMPEYWVEENIRPLSHQDSDQLLIEDLEPIVNTLKQRGIMSWHFLREVDNWRGSQSVRHIRLRFKATDLNHLKRIRGFLKRELDILMQNGVIVDHYVGKHGNPVRRYRDYYQGERGGFDEQVATPRGWSLVERHLEIGSEMALLLIRGRMNRVQLAHDYNFPKISHLFPNQCRHYPHSIMVQTQSGLRNWMAYDPVNPTV